MIVALTRSLWSAAVVFVVVPAADCPPANEPAGLEAVRFPDGNVDRVEAGIAVILTDEGWVQHHPACGLREGDVIRAGRADPAAREALEGRIGRRLERLRSGDDGKDLEL